MSARAKNRQRMMSARAKNRGPMKLRAVSRLVGSPKNDVPECLDDAEPSWGQQELL